MSSVILLDEKFKKSFLDKRSESGTFLGNKGIYTFDDYCITLINKFNSKYPKYRVSGVQIVDTPVISNAMNLGIIVKESKQHVRIPLAYVVVSTPTIGSRNDFGAQQLFPGMSYLIKKYIDSPSYTLANLPIYFVNGCIENVTDSMKISIYGMIIMDIGYVDVFENNPEIKKEVFRRDLKEYSLKMLYSKGSKNKSLIESEINRLKASNTIHTDFFYVDFSRKSVKFVNDYLIKKDKNGKIAMSKFGSSDRFFIMRSYPALILADEFNYDVDISEIEEFLNRFNKGKKNLEPFVCYANKLRERR